MNMNQYSVELHRPVRKVKKFTKVIVDGLDNTWAGDLADMSAEFVDQNDGYRYCIYQR